VDCLTVEQLGQIFVPDSTVQTWADVNPDWPAEDILLFAPDPDSGTRDYFIEAIIEPYVEDVLGLEGEEAEAMFDIRSDPALTFSTDDNVLLQGIAGEPTGLGFFGYAYYANNQESLKLIEVDGGGGCVAPSDETVQGGTYTPLSRPIFIYVNLESLERPEVYEYVKYYIEEGLQLVMADVGYSVPDDAVLQENLDRFAAATGG
jgi:phosphate transport system substrate-binding protein